MKNDLRYLMAYLRAQEYHFANLPAPSPIKPIVTISRQRGAKGKLIAQKLAEYLEQKNSDKQPWLVIDKSLTRHVMETQHLSQQICGFLTDEKAMSITERVEEMLGIKSPKWTVVEKMAQTMMQLAELGRVIFVGRAANLVTAQFPHACHVRLIGSAEQRVRHVMEVLQLSRDAAEADVKEVDYDRSHFVSQYFHVKIDDPTHYHLVINTDLISVEKAVLLIDHILPKAEVPSAEMGGCL